MNFWTPRIALIAYVLGGWLLPALHHHDHSAHQHGVGCSGLPIESVEIASSLTSSVEQSDCGCGHSHEGAAESQAKVASSLSWQTTHSHADCVDLCSLCVAASMSAASIDRAVALTNSVIPPCPVATGSQVWPAQPLDGSVSSRGPPVLA